MTMLFNLSAERFPRRRKIVLLTLLTFLALC